MTFKQLEALYWVSQLGGFLPASIKLNTAQSAISKRIQELEEQLGVPLFDRTQRSSRLTDKGRELAGFAKRLLDLHDEAIGQVSDASVIAISLKIGVTELTAMSWLPQFVATINQHFPKVSIVPSVDSSVTLRDNLLADELDLVIVPDAYSSPYFVKQRIGEVDIAWMCKPGLVPRDRLLTLVDVAEHTVLVNRSGPGLIYERFFSALNFDPPRTLSSNSIVALVSMAVAGLGIAYLPATSLGHLVLAGKLQHVDVAPALPPVTYVAIYKSGRRSELINAIVGLAEKCCDFSSILLANEGP